MNFAPSLDDPDLSKLENHIGSEFKSIQLLVEADGNELIEDCYNIVERKVKEFGGERILGWQVWKSNILIEGEAHAVWKDQNGVLHDISPKAIKVDKVVFIRDPRIVIENQPIDNKRLNITENKLVDDFIFLREVYTQILKKGKRHGPQDIRFEPRDGEMLNAFRLEINRLFKYIQAEANVNSSCLCGKNETYKNCHGKLYNELKNQIIL